MFFLSFHQVYLIFFYFSVFGSRCDLDTLKLLERDFDIPMVPGVVFLVARDNRQSRCRCHHHRPGTDCFGEDMTLYFQGIIT